MLRRLSIRQKLSLLLVIPLAAVGLVMVGFTAERIGDAAAANQTARTALAARNIGALIQTLQQERLLALGYLSVPTLQRSALVTQSQSAVDDTAQLAADPVTADVIAAAQPALDALTSVRRGVINRTVTPRAAYDAYRAANTALLDALRLGAAGTADEAGLSELVALDALMRSNEEASSVGAIVVAAATDPNLGPSLLTTVVAADAQNLRRFHQLVPAERASLVDTVESGQAGQRIRTLVDAITTGSAPASAAAVSDALTAALTYTGLRRLAQDRVARDVASGAESRAATARAVAIGSTFGAIVLFVGVVVLGVVVSRSIARPLRRLTRAAVVMADVSRAELVRVSDSDSPDLAPPRLASVQVDSADEIGELAAALNRVQATAALLIERQVSTRGNVSVMFANIARRTQNLVGRQLALIDELERNERDPELLQRLYRLDHVATRLRRSADSLLVVSGTIEQELSGGPTRLTDIVRSALAEIEGYQAVRLGNIPDVTVGAELVPDLRLLLAELFENATNFSPPGTPVEVTGLVEGDCYLAIVDHGVGMSTTRIEEENRRLVERERLDVTPTKVLGLFVVGRLARRHGLGVRLDPSEIRGVTVTVRIPARLLARAAEPLGGPQSPPPGPASPAWTQPAWIEPTRTEPGWTEGGWSGSTAGWSAPDPVALGAVPPAAIEALRAAELTGPFPWLEAGPMAIEGATPAAGGSEGATPAAGGSEGATPAAGGSEGATPAAGGSEGATPAAGGSEGASTLDEQWPGGIEEPVSPRAVPEPAATTLPPMRSAAAAFSAAASAVSSPGAPASDAGAPQAGGKPALAWPPPPAAPSPGAPLPRRTVAPIDPAFSADPRTSRAVRDEASPGSNGVPAEVPAKSSRGGLTRRVPGTHLADTVVVAPGSPGVARAQRNPDAERDALNDYLSGYARGSADPGIPSVEPDPEPEPESRPTLAERHS